MAIDSLGPAPLEPPPPAYPIDVQFDVAPASGRFWAIPLLGIFVKLILLIPSLIALYFIGLAVGVIQLGLWIPVLFTGHYSNFAMDLVGGYLRWSTRLTAYYFGLTDEYPPFTTRERTEMRTFATHFSISAPERSNRFWAIPFVGIVAKFFILIPHLVIVYVLTSVAALCMYVLWVPVLFTGRYPNWGYEFVGGTIRWSLRVNAYMFGLTDTYPPFAM